MAIWWKLVLVIFLVTFVAQQSETYAKDSEVRRSLGKVVPGYWIVDETLMKDVKSQLTSILPSLFGAGESVSGFKGTIWEFSTNQGKLNVLIRDRDLLFKNAIIEGNKISAVAELSSQGQKYEERMEAELLIVLDGRSFSGHLTLPERKFGLKGYLSPYLSNKLDHISRLENRFETTLERNTLLKKRLLDLDSLRREVGALSERIKRYEQRKKDGKGSNHEDLKSMRLEKLVKKLSNSKLLLEGKNRQLQKQIQLNEKLRLLSLSRTQKEKRRELRVVENELQLLTEAHGKVVRENEVIRRQMELQKRINSSMQVKYQEKIERERAKREELADRYGLEAGEFKVKIKKLEKELERVSAKLKSVKVSAEKNNQKFKYSFSAQSISPLNIKIVVVKASSVHEKPDVKSDVVLVASAGQILQSVGHTKDHSWYLVKSQRKSGYIYSEFVEAKID
ncbi:MAG: hypothetical protein VX617_01630 [Pseudomonadota bacterium]|nr:hypothetical protein [Pseudomonadota bacterium]